MQRSLEKISRGLCSVFLKLYRYSLAPVFMALGVRCRFEPSCSHYAELAVQRFGFRGLVLAFWRLARCHPFCRGGLDPVPLEIDRSCCG